MLPSAAKTLSKAFSQSAHTFESIHPSQTASFNDKLILVDHQDNMLSLIDKKTAHRAEYIKCGKPHRAFSLFLFDQNKRLLMHQRSDLKIAFPLAWTNSCCSHPMAFPKQNDQPAPEAYTPEDVKKFYRIEEPVTAVIRRTEFQLGLNISKESIRFVEKIVYKSAYDEEWGEYEVDHVFICRLSDESQTVKPNSEQIRAIEWVTKEQMQEFVKVKQSKGEYFSPWFKKIYSENLQKWWDII